MAIERGEASVGGGARAAKPSGKLFGSLREALLAAGREEGVPAAMAKNAPSQLEILPPAAKAAVQGHAVAGHATAVAPPSTGVPLTAADAARQARASREHNAGESATPMRMIETAEPPTTRVVRASRELAREPRTRLVRGRQAIVHDDFAQDPVVGFLIVVGGPGLGAARPVYEGNNTLGRAASNRIPLDFGDETISAEAQAYIRYDSTDRSFLFVPNLAKTNVVSVNDKRPAGAVELKAMDVLTFGRTQVAFLPFCGPEFDWSEISDAKGE